MPTANNEPVPDFDEVDLNSAPAPTEEEDLWAAPIRIKKKKKSKKNANTLFPGVAEAGTPYEEGPITPSAPTAPDVEPWDDDPDPIPSILDEPAPAENNVGFSRARVDYQEPPPTPPPARAHPVPSPRPATAKPVASSYSPQSRPTSLHYSPSPQYATPTTYRPATAPRRESNTAKTSPRPRFVEPVAPPHMAQPHFYGLPDLGLFGQKKVDAGKAAGSDGYCCCFDSFADAGDAVSSKKARNALLVGSEGGLEVFRVLPNKFEVVGRLEGLRGSVIGAKILPHVDLYDDMSAERPLVAVVVHGAMADDRLSDLKGDPDMKEPPSHYQTTVEIYSLQTQVHVTTLYASIPEQVEKPAFGYSISLPAPIGDLSVSAKGRFVVVASGRSGEIFVFSGAPTTADSESRFRCLGKFWTSLQSQLATSRPQSSSDGTQSADENEERAGVPLFSLSQRWLALVAPSTSSHISIQGSPALSQDHPNPPGLMSHVAPPQPAITRDIAGVDAEGAWSRLTRQAAQGLVKYSNKGIEMGWQGWKELTNPTTQSVQYHGRTASQEDRFPPTNAPLDDPRRTSKEPAVVSIIDLEALLEAEEQKPKYPPSPLATFGLEEGCNFLSFSSNGLRLLTASRKGEVSTIWDLTQANHGTTAHTVPSDDNVTHGPCIKQVHRIPRSSPSIIVDCTWSRDDDWLALQTIHGTVHLHEVPSRLPSRRRKRRSTVTAPSPEKAEPTVSVSSGLSPPSSNGFLGNIRSGWQQVSTQVNDIRSHNPVSTLGIPTSLAGFREAATNASHAGSRALAKGFSQGLSAAKGGAADYWHSEDNKIRHKALQGQVVPGSLRWIKRQSGTLLVVACGGTVHLHPVARLARRQGENIVSGLKHDKYGKKHFDLPPIRISTDVKPSPTNKVDGCATAGPHGFWSLRASPTAGERRSSTTTARPIPQQANEVETSPPYCPFHIDYRVNVCAFNDAMAGSQINLLDEADESTFHLQGHGLDEEQFWIFGEALPPFSRLNLHDHLHDDDDFNYRDTGITDSDLEVLAEQVESRLTVHTADEPGGERIRINTRPRRVRLEGEGEGEFNMMEDEDDGGGDVF